MTVTYHDIREAEDVLDELRTDYLRQWGWRQTSNMPGSYWLWRRDFSDIDVARHQRWEEMCASNPPLGNPSKPTPYGIITADTDLAISMTAREIDRSPAQPHEDDE